MPAGTARRRRRPCRQDLGDDRGERRVGRAVDGRAVVARRARRTARRRRSRARARPRSRAGPATAAGASAIAARMRSQDDVAGAGRLAHHSPPRPPSVRRHQARNDSRAGALRSRARNQPPIGPGPGMRGMLPATTEQPAAEARGALGETEPARAPERPGRGAEPGCLRRRQPVGRLGLADDLAAQVDEHLGDVDPDRADVEAGAAQRRRERQRRGLLVDRMLRDAAQLRRQDRADRARIDRPVGLAAGPLVDGADIQAGRAADAAQRLAPDACPTARPSGRCRAG